MKNKIWTAGCVGAAVLAAVAFQAWSGSACCPAAKKADCAPMDKAACSTNACPDGMSVAECKAKGLCPHKDQGTNCVAGAAAADATPSGK